MAIKRTIGCLMLTFLFSCEVAVEPMTGSDTSLVVVESVITNEYTPHLIRLTQTHASLNDRPMPVKHADVRIVAGDSVFIAEELPDSAGVYFTPPFRAITGKTYTLDIEYDNTALTASDAASAVEPLPPLTLISAGDAYEIKFTESGTGPNYIEYQIDWQPTPACSSGACTARIIYYDLKSVDVNDIFKPEKSPFTFPKGARIIRRKYSISTAYRNFLRAMLIETEWSGGVFGVTRSNVPTNVSEGGIGFFAVSTVVSDTTIVK